jgi:UDP-N-acetylglucosamine--N-acetylmuramyl-(pentapeptide) pyrophosphoryl-undecaprenol N-acetylglucosamine transferase
VPVRPEFLVADRSPEGQAKARAALGVEPGRALVVIVGGSLGARRLNDLGVGLRERYADRTDLVLHHVSGAREYDRVRAMEAPSGPLEYRLVRYEDRMADLLCAAAVVVGRAGAMTVAELRTIGVPAILVPLPGAPSDHQRKNAEALATIGAAVVVEDGSATPEIVGGEIDRLLSDPDGLEQMGALARSSTRRDAAGEIARIIDDVLAGERPRS